MKRFSWLSGFFALVNVGDCALIAPADPNALVPDTVYHSYFSNYDSFQKIQVTSWQRANEQVTQNEVGMKHSHEQSPTTNVSNHSDHSSYMNH